MPARYQIFSTNLLPYRPVLWLAQPVYGRYNQLRNLLQSYFVTDPQATHYLNLLAEPQIPQPADQARIEGRWFTDAFRSGTPLSALPADERTRVSQLLESRLAAIRRLADELEQTSADETRQLATLLRLAIEVPGPECVMVNGDQTVLVLWGFDSDRSRQDRFRISQYLSHQVTTSSASSVFAPSVSNDATEAPIASTVPILDRDNKRWRWWMFWRWRFGWPRFGQTVDPSVGPGATGGGCGCLGLLLGLLLLALLVGLLYWFWPASWGRIVWMPGSGPVSPYLPDRPGVVPPIDSSQIITDPTDSLRRPIVGNRLNVFLKKEANMSAFVDKLKQQYPATDWEVVSYDTVYNALQVQFPVDQRDVWRERLQKMTEVYVVFDEQLFSTSARPNDPAFSDARKSWYFGAVHAYQAWDITRGSPDVIVAVLDGGFDTNHPDLQNLFVKPRNTLADEPTVNADSPEGGRHGTHVAATIAGHADNQSGASGIAPNCRIIPIQVGDEMISSLALVYGVQYAIQNGAQIISMSLGSAIPPDVIARLKAMSADQQAEWLSAFQQTPQYQAEKALFAKLFGEAVRNNIVVVKATGNDGLPADFDPINTTPYTINVAAAGTPNASGATPLADFSNYGPLATVTAPGVRIFNAVAGGSYDYLDGTSMATPIVAGGVALIRSVRPDLSPAQIRSVLIDTGIPFVNNVRPVGPMIQLDKALLACRELPQDACAITADSLRRELSKLRAQLPAS